MAKKQKDEEKLKGIAVRQTPIARLAFPTLFEPRAYKKGAPPKYEATLLWSKEQYDDGTLKELRVAVTKAIKEKWGSDKSEWPERIKRPFKDGDKKSEYKGFSGMMYIRASTLNQPGIVDQKVKPIEDESKIFAGCYVIASLVFKAYELGEDNCGVTCYLQNIQLVKKGPRLDGGSRDPQEDFEVIESDEDEDDIEDEDEEDFEDFM